MKKLLIFIALLNFNICTIEECKEEFDTTKCSSHEINEYENIECVKRKLENSEEDCFFFPNSKDIQKEWIKFTQTMEKEIASMYPYDEDFTNPEDHEEKTYEIGGEIIKEEKYEITKDDLKIINSFNTCGYLFVGQHVNSLKILTNITEKDLCFKTKQFEGLKNILNCGYAVINTEMEGTKIQYQTCFYIPSNNMPKELEAYYKEYVLDRFAPDYLGFILYYKYLHFEEEIDYDERRLSDDERLKYEITIESEYGKVIKYNTESNKIEVISEGKTETNDESNNFNFLTLFTYKILIILFVLI